MRALESRVRQLAENAGLEGSVVVDKVRSAKAGEGLNVVTGEIEDLVKAGIIDPTMVTRSALQNAASIAKNILTTEAIVAEAPEKAGAGAGMPDMGGMGGMMYAVKVAPSALNFSRMLAEGPAKPALSLSDCRSGYPITSPQMFWSRPPAFGVVSAPHDGGVPEQARRLEDLEAVHAVAVRVARVGSRNGVPTVGPVINTFDPTAEM